MTTQPRCLLLKTPLTVLGLWLIAVHEPILAQDEHYGHTAGRDFGTVHFEISCSRAAQQQFDRAVAMLHSFVYPETESGFKIIVEREPSCAMAYWGIAMSQRPNPLTPPFPLELLKQGWDAIQKARAAATQTPRERHWIDALGAFFRNYDTVDQKTRSTRYAAAMARLHERYRNDTEAAAFYALALLEAVDLTDKTYSGQLEAAAILERFQKAQHEHPGIMHYLIHSYDYASIAQKGLPAARRYAALAPSAPHALYMPSHIFSMLGMWPEAIRSNRAAAATLGAGANPAGISGRYHAWDFLTYAHLQLLQDRAAKAIVDQCSSTAEFPAGERITGHMAFAAIPVRYAIERGAWNEAATLRPIKTPFPQAEAIVWFGRALGAARSGDIIEAKQDIRQISRLRRNLTSAGDGYWAEQVGIQETAASAWVALAEEKTEQAVSLMRNAADREGRTEKHVAMENRLSPMRELLGELLLEAENPREARREFERSLRTVPNRFRSLFGAGQSAARVGNRRLAKSYYRRVLSLTVYADTERLTLSVARSFLKQDGG